LGKLIHDNEIERYTAELQTVYRIFLQDLLILMILTIR